MCDQWMPHLRLPLTLEQFHELPRNAAYKYEYFDGAAWLSPRPKHYHAVLDLRPSERESGVALRHVVPEDFERLEHLFCGAFARHQPYGSLTTERRLQAAYEALEKTRTGGDGPWIERASFVAVDEDEKRVIGANFVTL